MAVELNMNMNMNMNALVSLVILFIASVPRAQSANFDVVAGYGAKADGKTDLSPALLKAFKEACAAPDASKILIPKGDYLLSEITFEGPCKAPLEIEVQGTIKAPATTPKTAKDPHWFEFYHLDHLTISGTGIFDGSGTSVWGKTCGLGQYCSQVPINLRLSFVNNSLVKDVTTKDSKQFHTNVLGCNNITFDNYHVSAPGDSYNTDGIHIGRSSNIHIMNTEIKTGDDCVSIGDGSVNVTIDGVTCGPGHGISIGSLGKFENEMPVDGVIIKKCTFDSSTNGVRVKTWPASKDMVATLIHFEDVTLTNVSNPIIIDQNYCPHGDCNKAAGSKVQLSEISFKNIKGTSATAEVVKLICSPDLPCIDVILDNVDIKYSGPEGPAKFVCVNVKPKTSGTMNPPACTGGAEGPASGAKGPAPAA